MQQTQKSERDLGKKGEGEFQVVLEKKEKAEKSKNKIK